MRTVVSITRLTVERDRHTFKQAASVARFGYTSIVVEGGTSNLDRASLPFGLRSLGKRSPGKAATWPVGSRLATLIGWLKKSPLRVAYRRYTRFAKQRGKSNDS